MAKDKTEKTETAGDAPEVAQDAAATGAAPDASTDAAEVVETPVEDAVAALPAAAREVTPEQLAEAIQTAIAKGRVDLWHNSPLSRVTEALNHVELNVMPGLTALILREVFE